MLVHVQCNCHVMWIPNTMTYIVLHYSKDGVDVSNFSGWLEVETEVITWGIIDDTIKMRSAAA